jgi:hypothetical protein
MQESGQIEIWHGKASKLNTFNNKKKSKKKILARQPACFISEVITPS